MVWTDTNQDAGQTSAFNSALFQMQRLHDLQSKINECNTNLLAFNEMIGIYNYQLMVSCLNSLFQEMVGKLSEKEKDQVEEIRNSITTHLEEYPIHKTRHHPNNHKPYIEFSEDIWRVHKKKLIEYETLIRELLDKHKLNAPSEELDGLF